MNDQTSTAPWVVFDPDTKAEFVTSNLLRYYVANVDGEWFICDRFEDDRVPGTVKSTRHAAIRAFYELNNRPIPEGIGIPSPVLGTSHRGIG